MLPPIDCPVVPFAYTIIPQYHRLQMKETNMASEEVIYRDGNITVTNTRAILGGKTYAMANVTSVAMGKKAANRAPGIIVTLVGVIVAGCTISGDGFGVGAVIGIMLLVAGIVVAVLVKDKYIVSIGSASGEINALTSPSKEYIMKIVVAINKAIARRG